MSNALEIYAQQYENITTKLHNSEEFQIVDGEKFYGVFDDSYILQSVPGNVAQRIRSVRIVTAILPPGVVAKTTNIIVRGTTYTVREVSTDANMGFVVWLF